MNIYELLTRRAYHIIALTLVCMYIAKIIHKHAAAIKAFRFLLLWLNCAFLYYPHNLIILQVQNHKRIHTDFRSTRLFCSPH